MLLPDHEIERLCGKGSPMAPLIEPFDPEYLQPASYDLRLERQFCLLGPNNVPFAADYFDLGPGKMVLGCTRERIWLPWHLAGEVSGKSSNARRGIQVEAAGHVDPGYCGVITLEIVNLSDTVARLFTGGAVAKIVFHTLLEKCRTPYNAERNTHQYSHGPKPL